MTTEDWSPWLLHHRGTGILYEEALPLLPITLTTQVGYKPYTCSRCKTESTWRYLVQVTSYLCTDTYILILSWLLLGQWAASPWNSFHKHLPEEKLKSRRKRNLATMVDSCTLVPATSFPREQMGCTDMSCNAHAMKPLQLGKSH